MAVAIRASADACRLVIDNLCADRSKRHRQCSVPSTEPTTPAGKCPGSIVSRRVACYPSNHVRHYWHAVRKIKRAHFSTHHRASLPCSVRGSNARTAFLRPYPTRLRNERSRRDGSRFFDHVLRNTRRSSEYRKNESDGDGEGRGDRGIEVRRSARVARSQKSDRVGSLGGGPARRLDPIDRCPSMCHEEEDLCRWPGPRRAGLR